MTSTSFNVGIGDGSRLSSRVLRPPGGGHTDIFGGEAETPRGRRAGPPQAASTFMPEAQPQGEQKAANGNSEAPQNGQEAAAAPEPAPQVTAEAKPEPKESPKQAEPASFNQPEPVKAEPAKRVRVPPGGFSSGLCMSESTGCGSARFDEDDLYAPVIHVAHADIASAFSEDDRFSPNIDLRYGGQYMTAEQLPTFCDQLHHLVEVVRNIQSYAHVTGEYPAELEKRLEREACEVAALAAEMRNAHEVIQRTRIQRRALRDHKTQLQEQLASLKETEVRELESTVRLSDRKLYKSWEMLKDASDPASYDALLDEIKTKNTALECLLRLIDSRRATLLARPTSTTPQPLPPPMPKDSNEESSTNGIKKRHERRANKRRRNKEPHSVPVSSEPSAHAHLPQVTLYIQGSETGARRATVPLAPLDLPSGGSVRDILFFTANTA